MFPCQRQQPNPTVKFSLCFGILSLILMFSLFSSTTSSTQVFCWNGSIYFPSIKKEKRIPTSIYSNPHKKTPNGSKCANNVTELSASAWDWDTCIKTGRLEICTIPVGRTSYRTLQHISNCKIYTVEICFSSFSFCKLVFIYNIFMYSSSLTAGNINGTCQILWNC